MGVIVFIVRRKPFLRRCYAEGVVVLSYYDGVIDIFLYDSVILDFMMFMYMKMNE